MILLLDNKDSFVWNLAQALGALGREVDVVRSDVVDLDGVGGYDAVVISPGPGRPEHAGRSVACVQRWSGRVPMLGVCLGHQAIAFAFGGEVVRGEPVHGRPTDIEHDGDDLFEGLPRPLSACRYHSLYVTADLPEALRVTARGDGGAVMALRHREHPTFGVQFHPESFRTEHGDRLLANFVRRAASAASA